MTRRTTYLAGLLGKVRGEATNSSHVDDKNEDDEDHDDIAWSEEQDESDDDDCSVSVLPKPGEASSSDIEDYGPYWNNSSESKPYRNDILWGKLGKYYSFKHVCHSEFSNKPL